MIIAQLKGGLGNQMFQYAFARSLAQKNKSTLYLDISWFYTESANKPDRKREYFLGDFDTHGKVIKLSEIKILGISINYLNYISWANKILRKRIIEINEKKLNCQDLLSMDLRNTLILLEGYWQSEKYFEGIRNPIQKELTLLRPLAQEENNIVKEMLSCNSVSLHIRRGDYVRDPRTKKRHGVLNRKYYEDACDFLKEKIGDLKLFIFSDDVEWCMDNLSFNAPWKVVSDKIRPISQELILLSKCTHHIIANSSFSWWGAWLGEKDNSIVIAPKKWFNSGITPEGIVPERWIRL